MFLVIFICGNLFLKFATKTEKIRTHKNFVPPGSHLEVREQQWKLLTPEEKVSKISAVDKGVPKAMAFMKKTTLNRQVKRNQCLPLFP